MRTKNGNENIIWRIREIEELTDTFRTLKPSINFQVTDKIVEGWPSFHASPADYDGKYNSYEYSIHFEIEKITDVQHPVIRTNNEVRYRYVGEDAYDIVLLSVDE